MADVTDKGGSRPRNGRTVPGWEKHRRLRSYGETFGSISALWSRRYWSGGCREKYITESFSRLALERRTFSSILGKSLKPVNLCGGEGNRPFKHPKRN